MQYNLVTNTFGGVNYKLAPKNIGPNNAQAVDRTEVSAGVLRGQWADEAYATEAYGFSKYDYNGVIINDLDTRRVYAEYGGRLVRSCYAPIANCVAPQYSTDASTWHILGVKGPAAACTAADSGAGAGLTGTYTYYVTFYNVFGDESPPSAGSTPIAIVDNLMSLSVIPIGYGTGTITNGLPTITTVTNVSYFRVGMRIQSPTAGIPAGAYITGISGTTITMSANATAGVGGITLQDAQVTGRKIYRSGGTVASTLLVTTLADITTTTYSDSTTDVLLGAAITTSGYDVFGAIGGISIAPNGVMGGILAGSTAGRGYQFHFSEVGLPGLRKSTDYITLPEEGVSTFYGLDRFLVFTIGTPYSIAGSGRTDFEAQKANAPAPIRANGTTTCWAAPVQMDDAVWFTSLAGLMAFSAGGVQCISHPNFTQRQAEYLHLNCVGATRHGRKYLLMSTHEPSSATPSVYENLFIYTHDPDIAGNWYTQGGGVGYITGGIPTGTVYYSKTLNRSLYYCSTSAGVGATKVLADGYAGSATPETSVSYWTGEWVGDSELTLKKLRKFSAVYKGALAVYVYVDGVSVATIAMPTRTAIGRGTAWLPSGTRGRAVSLKLIMGYVYGYGFVPEVHEVGVYVGEQRQAAP